MVAAMLAAFDVLLAHARHEVGTALSARRHAGDHQAAGRAFRTQGRHRQGVRPATRASRSSSFCLKSRPPPNPHNVPLLAITRWHGTMIGHGFRPRA